MLGSSELWSMGSECNLGALDALDENSILSILKSWEGFCKCTKLLIAGNGDMSVSSEFISDVHSLCNLGLDSLVCEHFLLSLEEAFEKNGALRFWSHFECYSHIAGSAFSQSLVDDTELEEALCKALEEISLEKQYQEKCLQTLAHALLSHNNDILHKDSERNHIVNKYQLSVSSVLMASVPRQFPEILLRCFKKWLEELSMLMTEGMDTDGLGEEDEMNFNHRSGLVNKTGETDINRACNPEKTQKLITNIGRVVRDLRGLGFTSMSEDAYASAIFSLLKAKVHELAGDEFRISVLQSVKGWIQAVPLQFLRALLSFLGESVSYNNSSSSSLKSPLASHPSSCYPGIDTPSEGLVRWQLRLEYFAYETLQDLRIAMLFEIIVDYPESSPAIEDLKQCLEYTGQHSKLVDSFISALRYRLLTAGASTNDILHQYVSTIKALRTIDPAGIFLESVGEPIRDYLRGRKDTIKCIVTMLTDGSGGNSNAPGSTGESLLEELNRDEEDQEDAGVDEELHTDDKQAWINAQRWEPDPVEADPSKGSRGRRKVDILGMIVSIIGSKDQLVNEYRVILAEKFLNKSDYDIEAEIRTLELLKLHFGEGSMQKCEIMLNDLIDSKRTNSNIKATINQPSQPTDEDAAVSLDVINATIISSNFWPPIQEEDLKLPSDVDQLLSDYAKRYNEIKTPRKLLWKKNLGTVKLELQFEDKAVEFVVAPIHATIVMQFQEQASWDLKSLSAAIGVPADVLQRRINFWISKGILVESDPTDSNDHVYTLVDSMADTAKNGVSGGDDIAVDEGENSVASVEAQLRKEMTVYEKFILGMLKNFGSMALDRIHNTLKMFCISDPPYDKSLQQLQSFLSGLVSEEKLELRDGMYVLKK